MIPRTVNFIDFGEPGWRPIVFFGGLGTSARAQHLTEHFAPGLRETLRLRVISVERNGFGDTAFDPSLGYAEAVDDVLAVLERLGVARFGIVAFSGGGPYGARLAARVPERVVSLHLAAAAVGGASVSGGASAMFADPAALAADPATMWGFPVNPPPGFAEAAAAEAVHAIGRNGHGAAALAHEWRLLCSEPLPDLSAVTAAAYLYWGGSDELVPPAHAAAWRRALPNIVALRGYPGEGHDVHYRHWERILCDAAEAEDG
jgi:non-heme chloroperoxidase